MNRSVRINLHQLAEALQSVVYVADTSGALAEAFSNVRLTVVPARRHVALTASDGYRLAYYAVDCDTIVTNGEEWTELLPAETAQALIQLARSYNTTRTVDFIPERDGRLRIKTNGLDVTIPLFRGTYPNVDRLMALGVQDYDMAIRLSKSTLYKTMNLMSRRVALAEVSVPMAITFKRYDSMRGLLMEIGCAGCNAALLCEGITLTKDWVSFRVESVYLAQALAAIAEEEVTLYASDYGESVTGRVTPLLLVGKGSVGRHFVQPMPFLSRDDEG